MADEIRKLAEQSKNSSSEKNNLISVNSNETTGVINTTGEVNSELSNQTAIIDESMVAFTDIIKAIVHIFAVNYEMLVRKWIRLIKIKIILLEKIETASAVAEENSAS